MRVTTSLTKTISKQEGQGTEQSLGFTVPGCCSLRRCHRHHTGLLRSEARLGRRRKAGGWSVSTQQGMRRGRQRRAAHGQKRRLAWHRALGFPPARSSPGPGVVPRRSGSTVPRRSGSMEEWFHGVPEISTASQAPGSPHRSPCRLHAGRGSISTHSPEQTHLSRPLGSVLREEAPCVLTSRSHPVWSEARRGLFPG